ILNISVDALVPQARRVVARQVKDLLLRRETEQEVRHAVRVLRTFNAGKRAAERVVAARELGLTVVGLVQAKVAADLNRVPSGSERQRIDRLVAVLHPIEQSAVAEAGEVLNTDRGIVQERRVRGECRKSQQGRSIQTESVGQQIVHIALRAYPQLVHH